jgi:hypothetical protein
LFENRLVDRIQCRVSGMFNLLIRPLDGRGVNVARVVRSVGRSGMPVWRMSFVDFDFIRVNSIRFW